MSTGLVVRLVFWAWFAAALYVGQQLVLTRLAPVSVPALALGLAGLLAYLYVRVAAVRAWADALDLRALVLLHVVRFLGIYLLVLDRRGALPHDYAVSAGLADIVVATFALPVALAPLDDDARRRAIRIWNIVGLISLLLATASAIRLNLADPLQLRAFAHLPLSLLPTFLVPVLLASHVVIFARLARPQSPA